MKRVDRRSDAARAYRAAYHTPQWRKLRAEQLRRSPMCSMCKQAGHVTAASVVDHIKPHRGSVSMMFDPSNLQSLCKLHHDSAKQREERRGKVIGSDASGAPLDASHHWNV